MINVEISVNKKEFKNFINILSFENKLGYEKAEYFSITNCYLWRRDAHRLVSYRLKKESDCHYNYKVKDLEVFKNNIKMFKMGKEGDINLPNKTIKPVKESLNDDYLNLLKNDLWDGTFKVNAMDLTKFLSIIQRELINKNKNTLQNELKINVFNDTIEIVSKSISFRKQFKLNEPVRGKYELVFNFQHFKELLINALSFNKEITFNLKMPYYCKIDLSQDVSGVLMLKTGGIE